MNELALTHREYTEEMGVVGDDESVEGVVCGGLLCLLDGRGWMVRRRLQIEC